ncbi:hypothetical protein D6D01_07734 [Aureobasidium pullulans]|uniref:RBR-type E3 ubiquitin transferase n=1 Tax=Aureobasidium pullulans TaxID=5580 RepID=A0A4S9KKZ2_AURPU|nr:hypothetical protein D6D01_07734 [Aureobasidium pullulans]
MIALKRRASTPPVETVEPPKKKRVLSRRTCTVCDTNKGSNQFPSSTKVSSHDHGANVCRACYMLHIHNEIDSKMWDQVACPECAVLLGYEEVKNMTNAENFKKYDEAAFRAVISADAEFHYCMSTTCKSGQGHPAGIDEPIFCCRECGHKHCVSCETNWHEGLTCAQYQDTLQRAQEEVQSQQEVAKISKPCPKCRVPIQKNSGCDHMKYALMNSAGFAPLIGSPFAEVVIIITTWAVTGTDQIQLQDQLLNLLHPLLSRGTRRKPTRRNLSAMTAAISVTIGGLRMVEERMREDI